MGVIGNRLLGTSQGADTGLRLLSAATLWADAKDVLSGKEQILPNRVGGEFVQSGYYGGATIIRGGYGLFMSGNTADYARTSSASWNHMTGNIGLKVWAVPDDHTPAADSDLVGKYNAAPNQRGWRLYIASAGAAAGKLVFNYSTTGVNYLYAVSSVAVGTDTVGFWVERNSTTGDVTFYTTTDGDSWTQLGTVISTTPGAMYASTATVCIGMRSDFQTPFAGVVHKVEIYDDTTLVASPDFTAVTDDMAPFTDGQGVVWETKTRTDSGDMKGLPHSGTHYGYLPGTADNYLTTPHTAAQNLAGDLDIRFIGTPTDYTPGTVYGVYSKWNSGTNNKSWIMSLGTDGKLQLYYSIDGSTTLSGVSTAAVPEGENWRITRSVSTGDIVFYTAATGGAWTALGSTVGGTAGALFSSNQAIEISGPQNLGSWHYSGTVYKAELYDGIDGTLVTSLDLDRDIRTKHKPNQGQASIVSQATGETWTVERGTSDAISAIVTRPVLLRDAVSSHLRTTATEPTITHNSGQLSFGWCGRLSDATPSWRRIMSSESAGNVGIYLSVSSDQKLYAFMGDGTTNKSLRSDTAAVASTDIVACIVVYDAGSMTMYASDGTSSTATYTGGTPAAFNPFRIGSGGNSTVGATAIETYCAAAWAGTALTEEQAFAVIRKLIDGSYN